MEEGLLVPHAKNLYIFLVRLAILTCLVIGNLWIKDEGNKSGGNKTDKIALFCSNWWTVCTQTRAGFSTCLNRRTRTWRWTWTPNGPSPQPWNSQSPNGPRSPARRWREWSVRWCWEARWLTLMDRYVKCSGFTLVQNKGCTTNRWSPKEIARSRISLLVWLNIKIFQQRHRV